MGDDLRMWGLFVAAACAKVFGDARLLLSFLSRFHNEPAGLLLYEVPLVDAYNIKSPVGASFCALSTKSPPGSRHMKCTDSVPDNSVFSVLSRDAQYTLYRTSL
jgi:hypothetical protein